MTAAATKVKQITVTFNKAVDTTTTKLVVKKGAATPTVTSTTFAADAKSAEIVMGTKLTAGTYTVEATVGEEKLTADITVEDEKLTKYELVGSNLVASATATTVATISYKALNQYDEMMTADAPTVTCTFGTTDGAKGGEVKPASVDKSGLIKVAEINTSLAIPGTTGTIVLVDSKTGVNLQTSVTYQSKAFAASATVYGVYSLKTNKLIEGNLTTGSKVADYAILMSVKDQYENAMTPENIKDSKVDFTFTSAPILTDMKLKYDKIDGGSYDKFKDVSYEGADAFLVPLDSKSGSKIETAGTLSITIVSSGKGMVANPSFTVDKAVVVKSLSVAPASTVYAGEDNKMIVEAYDPAGNAITKYDDLKGIVATSSAQTDDGTETNLTWKKNADGTGTLYFKPHNDNVNKDATTKNQKESTIGTIIFKANDATSTDYIVKTINVTYYEARTPVAVAGKGEKTITACASGSSLELDLTSLLYEDQYGNVVKTSDTTAKPATNAVSILISKGDVFAEQNSSAAKIVTSASDIIKNNLTLHANKKGDATLYFRYGAKATDEKYDAKISISATEVNDMVTSDLKLVVNKGNAVYVTDTAVSVKKFNTTTTEVDNHEAGVQNNVYVYVTGVVNGKTVVLPSSQYTIVTDEIGKLGKVEKEADKKTETKTITVVVDSESGAQTLTADVTVSNIDPTITTLKEAATGAVSVADSATAGTTEIKAADLIKAVKILDQYGNEMNKSANASKFTYSVDQTGTITEATKIKVTHPSTQDIVIVLPKAGTEYTADVTITTKDGKLSFTKAITMTTT